MVVNQTEARAQLSSTITDYHEPFGQGFTVVKIYKKNFLQLSCSDVLLHLKYTFISHALKATYQGSLCYVHLGSSEVIDSAELTSGASSSVNSQSTVPSAVTEHRRVFNYAGRGAHTFQPRPS